MALGRESASACSGELVAVAEGVDASAKFLYDGRVGARIECLVLLPSAADQLAIAFEIALLHGLEQLQSMLLHVVEEGEVA